MGLVYGGETVSDVRQEKLSCVDNDGILSHLRRIMGHYNRAGDSALGCARSSTKNHLPFASPKTLLDSPVKAVAGLRQKVESFLPDGHYHAVAWGNVLSRGDWLEPHDHRYAAPEVENFASAIYYAKAEGGEIVFEGHPPIVAETGLLLLFPPTLKHEVPYYDSPGDRVSVAFNFRLVKE